MRRTKEDAEATRALVLKAALSVFSAKGYAAATLEDVAKVAHVTRGAIYWHFENKADLYNTLVGDLSARGASLVQQATAEGGSLLEILRRVLVRQFTLIEEDSDARAVMELALFKTGLNPELEPGRGRQLKAGHLQVQGLADAMRLGIGEGVLRNDLDPVDMARSFIAFGNGVIHLWLVSPTSFSLRASANAFADLLISGLEPKP
ncbi:MAG: TetR family transcriptional regulator [Caulobacterales bacterium]